ncbi:hypothetical protein RHMOL_Rhmol12G0089200 [Rhododendron molle]|uniref:Uncharacterized protein n=1 Tax=Rhododendron molle TaxID=49168 RepID=A0ACC0LGU9_RHOML|nr:hypothetical protein RHMOL_Rhmol12G0089200 [Rhododendron molle]
MELGVKVNKLNHKNRKISTSSLSSNDIRNRSSILFKKARKTFDLSPTLGIEIRGGSNYILKEFVEMQEREFKEMIYA